MYTHYRYLLEHVATGEKRTVLVKKGAHIPRNPGEKVTACIGGCTIRKGDDKP